ncbi:MULTISPECIES: hypothetical protein [unclassified Halomonas]|uniref:hypothetical protein n=1 Tax=unclassified Halomonas TaxID=2609666 RepID=UPI002076ACF9|nr:MULTISPECIES: hypothetical protein [unclassified Halomonas]
MRRDLIIKLRAESICEAVHDGDAEGVGRFGTYLNEVGDLTSEVHELTATTMVADMVEAYIKTPTGKGVLSEWAKDVAEDEQSSVEEDIAEQRANEDWAA